MKRTAKKMSLGGLMKKILTVLFLLSLNAYAQVDILNYWSKGINLSDTATTQDLADWDVQKVGNQKIYINNKEFGLDEHGGYSHKISKGKQKIILVKKEGAIKELTQIYEANERLDGKAKKLIYGKKVKYNHKGNLDFYSECHNKGGLATCSTVNKFYCESLLKAFGNILPTKEKVANIKTCVKEINEFSKAINLAKINRQDDVEFNQLIKNGDKVASEIRGHLKTPVKNLERNFEDLSSIDDKSQDLLALTSACKEYFELSDHSYSAVEKIIKAKPSVNNQ